MVPAREISGIPEMPSVALRERRIGQNLQDRGDRVSGAWLLWRTCGVEEASVVGSFASPARSEVYILGVVDILKVEALR